MFYNEYVTKIFTSYPQAGRGLKLLRYEGYETTLEFAIVRPI